jgi:nucleotide-binding universal stress UspA family protein
LQPSTSLGITRHQVAFPADPSRERKVRLAGKPVRSPFADVLCAVDESPGGVEAVRQAVALSGPGATVRSLESDRLLAESADADLLAIDCHGGSSRSGGSMLGSVATELAHRTTVPLLIARRSAEGEGEFPRAVLLASDGSPGSWPAMRIAGRIARLRGSSLRVVYVPDGHPERYRELFKQVNELERLTGAAPVFLDAPGDPARRIAEAGRAGRSSLVVIGKRGRNGVKSLGSVSERVLQRASCSVLVVPPAARCSDDGDRT